MTLNQLSLCGIDTWYSNADSSLQLMMGSVRWPRSINNNSSNNNNNYNNNWSSTGSSSRPSGVAIVEASAMAISCEMQRNVFSWISFPPVVFVSWFLWLWSLINYFLYCIGDMLQCVEHPTSIALVVLASVVQGSAMDSLTVVTGATNAIARAQGTKWNAPADCAYYRALAAMGTTTAVTSRMNGTAVSWRHHQCFH